jgi:hypothetical protein
MEAIMLKMGLMALMMSCLFTSSMPAFLIIAGMK